MARIKDKENKILESSMRVFSNKGFVKTSIQDIADEAGIGKGTVYEYFKSKDELFVASFRNESEKYIGAMAAIIGGEGDFRDKLKALIGFVYSVHAEHGESMKMIAHDSMGYLKEENRKDFREVFCEVRTRNASNFGGLLKQGMDENVVGDIEIGFASNAILDLIFFTAASRGCFGYGNSRESVEMRMPLIIDLIMNGISK